MNLIGLLIIIIVSAFIALQVPSIHDKFQDVKDEALEKQINVIEEYDRLKGVVQDVQDTATKAQDDINQKLDAVGTAMDSVNKAVDAVDNAVGELVPDGKVEAGTEATTEVNAGGEAGGYANAEAEADATIEESHQ